MEKAFDKPDTLTTELSTTNEVSTDQTATPTQPQWRDYLELTKPKVVALLMLTAIVGMHLATPGYVPITTLLLGSLGLAMAMGGAAGINHVIDQRADSVMRRTQNRPVATGRIPPQKALLFAATLCLSSFIILDVFINRLTAVLTMLGAVGYACIYTIYLKRTTPQNIVIGGLAGAIPPLLGWTAVTNDLHPYAWLLVLIVFVWTPPHFWALAIHRRDDYAKADIPMLPVTHGIDFTKTQVLLYTVLLSMVALLPYLTGMSGWVYLLSACALNAVFLYYALRLKYETGTQYAMPTFAYSIIYLFALFIALLIDHYWVTSPLTVNTL